MDLNVYYVENAKIIIAKDKVPAFKRWLARDGKIENRYLKVNLRREVRNLGNEGKTRIVLETRNLEFIDNTEVLKYLFDYERSFLRELARYANGTIELHRGERWLATKIRFKDGVAYVKSGMYVPKWRKEVKV